MLKAHFKKCVDWSLVDKKKYLAAMERSVSDATDKVPAAIILARKFLHL